ncbi:hypothetical protein BDK92_1179 [Micromonospora pisi]|uniref:Uncharacterized protein n=1 Tax=Micromonospora pisi TaxID=589240 RepID=A0A495JFR9_9ACTN|nr:hypothetical protein BDK92_1179 [Micromonospora pisi]
MAVERIATLMRDNLDEQFSIDDRATYRGPAKFHSSGIPQHHRYPTSTVPCRPCGSGRPGNRWSRPRLTSDTSLRVGHPASAPSPTGGGGPARSHSRRPVSGAHSRREPSRPRRTQGTGPYRWEKVPAGVWYPAVHSVPAATHGPHFATEHAQQVAVATEGPNVVRPHVVIGASTPSNVPPWRGFGASTRRTRRPRRPPRPDLPPGTASVTYRARWTVIGSPPRTRSDSIGSAVTL